MAIPLLAEKTLAAKLAGANSNQVVMLPPVASLRFRNSGGRPALSW